ncbi:amino acid adenylation domain-containing protein [Streptomyces sp. NPDC092359]|uniref:amino acid adenylation domain-containing protein n=1 Tax=Streptomyces sp. NPDC092359 TaxID=3366014 RepID=UPI00382BE21A
MQGTESGRPPALDPGVLCGHELWSTAHACPVTVRLSGDLDADRLARCLDELTGGDPTAPTWAAEPTGPHGPHGPESPLPGLPPDAGLRARLLRHGPQEHVLALLLHPSLCSGRFLTELFHELFARYRGQARGSFGPLSPVVPTDRAPSDGTPPAVLDLPVDFPRASPPSRSGAWIAATVPVDLATSLTGLGNRTGATLSDIVLGALNLLLGRLGDTDDVTVAVADAAPAPGHLRLLRTGLLGNEPFLDLLRRSRPAARGLEHTLSWGQLIQDLRPGALGAVAEPPFPVLFESVPEPPRLAGVSLEFLPSGHPVQTPFPLALRLREGSEPELRLLYRTSMFAPARARTLLDQLTGLLGLIADDPGRPISSYRLTPEHPSVPLPDPSAPLPEQPYPLVRDLVQAWAWAHPDAVAVDQGGRTLGYAALVAAADRIRAALAARGLAPGDVVAVYGPHSPGLVASLLAVFSGGGVLLALDRRLPDHRLHTMLDQAGAAFLLLVEEDGRPAGRDVLGRLETVRVDAASAGTPDLGPAPRQPARPALPPILSDAPACVFYTSGSTGTPKGVVSAHNSVSHYLVWHRDTFGIGPEDRCPLIARLSFDAVLRDVFLPLVSGATLCLAERGDELAPHETLAWVADAGITCLHAVPTVAQSWLTGTPAPVAPTVRLTTFAGEPLTGELVGRWRTTAPSARIANLYGTTESVVIKSWYEVPGDCPDGVLPVGSALPGSQVLVLGPARRPCGVGEAGEVVFRGPYRSRGYWNTKADTASPFTANPHTGDPADLLLPTGDKGRYRPDGSVELLGRLDRQVKIRGVRIEPGEVAAVLAAHPRLAQAAVTAQRDAAGDTVLAAHVVTAAGQPVTARELRRYLGERLPAVMVPAVFAFRADLPRTASGKTDLDALAAPGSTRTAARSADPPRTATEAALCALWAEAFGLERVGREEDFFDLGGQSLLAARIVSGIRARLGVDLQIPALFDSPTVAELAIRVGESTTLVPSAPVRRPDPVPLAPAQQRLWFLQELRPDSSAYHMSRAYRLSGATDTASLRRALDAVVARHEVLRTRITTASDGLPCQTVDPPGPVPLGLHDLSTVPAELRETEAARLLADLHDRPFRLALDSVLRPALVRLGEDDHVLSLTIHHIACDDWSFDLLERELSARYGPSVPPDGPSTAPLRVQYADYAAAQHALLSGTPLGTTLDHWRSHLTGAPPVLPLPTDRPHPKTPSYQGAAQHFRIDAPLREALLALARAEGATLHMTLLAAWQVVLGRASGRTDLLVGVPVANRPDAAAESLIGFFVNTLVLRADLTGAPDFRRLIARTRKSSLEAYTHAHLPFDRLVRELDPPREPGRTPLVQAIFQVVDSPGEGLSLPGLTVTRFPMETRTTHFELEMEITDDGRVLTGRAVHSTEIFDAATVRGLVEQYLTLLRTVVAAPDVPLDLPTAQGVTG